MSPGRGAAFALACGMAIAITLAIGARGGKSGDVASMPIEPAAPATRATGLVFTNHHGEAVSEHDLVGEFLLVFFGYTRCPDVCPTGLQVMTNALRRLGPLEEQVRPVFISLDSARDTPAVLREYLSHFHPRFLGLTGSEAQISAAAQAYDVLFVRGAPDTSGGYAISHEDDFYLVGAHGEAIAILDGDDGSGALASEIEDLLSHRLGGLGQNRGDS